ncbi:MAG: DegT/DnrJ/EryC1/StrS family aminotransferase [Acidobacteriaceae bacterium]
MNSSAVQAQEAISPLDLPLQYRSIRTEINTAIEQVLESQHFTLGPQVEALENEIALFCGRRFGVGVGSGTDALTIALCASDIGPGDEVLLPPFTFIATADCVSALGAVPVFVDIDPATFCIDPDKLEAKVTPRTKAIVPVHLYGHPAEMDRLLALAARHNLRVIEDNAQAIGAKYKGKRTASLGDVGCLSFFPSKNLGGYGDGGMIVTDSSEFAARLRSLRAHGATKKYFSVEQGWNSRLDELQAAILRVKLRHLEEWNEGRRSRAALYDAALSGVDGIAIPRVVSGCEHVFHQYTVRVQKRDQVQKAMRDRGITTMVYYPVPIHLQPIYSGLGHQASDFSESELAAEQVLSLPIYPELSDEQGMRVANALIDAVNA